MKNAERILNQIAKHSSTTSIGLLAGDLRLSTETVRRHVDTLIAAGRVEIGHDGQQLEITTAEIAERAVNARVASHR